MGIEICPYPVKKSKVQNLWKEISYSNQIRTWNDIVVQHKWAEKILPLFDATYIVWLELYFSFLVIVQSDL